MTAKVFYCGSQERSRGYGGDVSFRGQQERKQHEKERRAQERRIGFGDASKSARNLLVLLTLVQFFALASLLTASTSQSELSELQEERQSASRQAALVRKLDRFAEDHPRNDQATSLDETEYGEGTDRARVLRDLSFEVFRHEILVLFRESGNREHEHILRNFSPHTLSSLLQDVSDEKAYDLLERGDERSLSLLWLMTSARTFSAVSERADWDHLKLLTQKFYLYSLDWEEFRKKERWDYLLQGTGLSWPREDARLPEWMFFEEKIVHPARLPKRLQLKLLSLLGPSPAKTLLGSLYPEEGKIWIARAGVLGYLTSELSDDEMYRWLTRWNTHQFTHWLAHRIKGEDELRQNIELELERTTRRLAAAQPSHVMELPLSLGKVHVKYFALAGSMTILFLFVSLQVHVGKLHEARWLSADDGDESLRDASRVPFPWLLEFAAGGDWIALALGSLAATWSATITILVVGQFTLGEDTGEPTFGFALRVMFVLSVLMSFAACRRAGNLAGIPMYGWSAAPRDSMRSVGDFVWKAVIVPLLAALMLYKALEALLPSSRSDSQEPVSDAQFEMPDE